MPDFNKLPYWLCLQGDKCCVLLYVEKALAYWFAVKTNFSMGRGKKTELFDNLKKWAASVVVFYLSGLNMMVAIVNKEQYAMVATKTKEAKIVGGDFIWILPKRS